MAENNSPQERGRQEEETEQNPEVKPNIDSKTGITGKGSAASATGTGSKADKGAMHEAKPDQSTETINTGDPHAQANLGGRNPGEGRPAMGDQDSSQNRNDMNLVDPVTSRAPDKLDKIKKSDGKGGLATRDP